MNVTTVITSVLLLVVGAAVGIVPTYLIERRKERHTLAVRWDVPLFDLCRDFASVVRQFLHLARRYGRAQDIHTHAARVDEQHQRIRALAQQIRLLGSLDLQQAAREVEHHAWWVREVCEGRDDKLAEYYPGSPEDRLRAAMHRLLVEARRQLNVHDAAGVATDEAIDPRNPPSPAPA